MPRLTKIYTRTGDDGTTALGTTKRVSKDDFRVATYGDIDELNAVIGLAVSTGLEELTISWLNRIQNELFNLGSQLAFPSTEDKSWKIPVIEQRHVDLMEANIYPLVVRIDDQSARFNQDFFYKTPNSVMDWIELDDSLQACLHLVDVAAFRPSYHLELVMDDDAGQAIAFLTPDAG